MYLLLIFRYCDLQPGEGEKEDEMSSFILRLADIKAWLASTENTLAQDLPPNERAAVYKVSINIAISVIALEYVIMSHSKLWRHIV